MSDYDIDPDEAGGLGGTLCVTPPSPELRDEMVSILASVARKAKSVTPRAWPACVAAAGKCIDAIDRVTDPCRTLVQLLGSDEAALVWMQETIPKLQARIAAKTAQALPEHAEDEENERRTEATTRG